MTNVSPPMLPHEPGCPSPVQARSRRFLGTGSNSHVYRLVHSLLLANVVRCSWRCGRRLGISRNNRRRFIVRVARWLRDRRSSARKVLDGQAHVASWCCGGLRGRFGCLGSVRSWCAAAGLGPLEASQAVVANRIGGLGRCCSCRCRCNRATRGLSLRGLEGFRGRNAAG